MTGKRSVASFFLSKNPTPNNNPNHQPTRHWLVEKNVVCLSTTWPFWRERWGGPKTASSAGNVLTRVQDHSKDITPTDPRELGSLPESNGIVGHSLSCGGCDDLSKEFCDIWYFTWKKCQMFIGFVTSRFETKYLYGMWQNTKNPDSHNRDNWAQHQPTRFILSKGRHAPSPSCCPEGVRTRIYQMWSQLKPGGHTLSRRRRQWPSAKPGAWSCWLEFSRADCMQATFDIFSVYTVSWARVVVGHTSAVVMNVRHGGKQMFKRIFFRFLGIDATLSSSYNLDKHFSSKSWKKMIFFVL